MVKGREARENMFTEREKRIKEMHEKELRDHELRVLKERELHEGTRSQSSSK